MIVGTALSPEFIYTVGPGDLMPDDRRYGIVWMSEKALASAYDLDGAFSSVSVKLQRGASESEVIARLDSLLDGYGGQAAHGRKDQTSHAWLDHELDMLNNMSRTLPPIFLLVSAFLVNLTLSRLVALEREQIGLLKALGYRDSSIVLHYLKFVALIVLIGIVIGSVVGTWLGLRVTALFGDFFHFPFLLFAKSPDLYAIAGALSAAAAAIGAIRALREVVSLPPAVAMQPPAPPSFHRLLPASLFHGQDRFATDVDDAAQHLAPSGTSHIHRARDGARNGDPRRIAIHPRHDGATDRRDLLPGRPAGCDDRLCREADGKRRYAGGATSGRACRRAIPGGPGPDPKRQC